MRNAGLDGGPLWRMSTPWRAGSGHGGERSFCLCMTPQCVCVDGQSVDGRVQLAKLHGVTPSHSNARFCVSPSRVYCLSPSRVCCPGRRSSRPGQPRSISHIIHHHICIHSPFSHLWERRNNRWLCLLLASRAAIAATGQRPIVRAGKREQGETVRQRRGGPYKRPSRVDHEEDCFCCQTIGGGGQRRPRKIVERGRSAGGMGCAGARANTRVRSTANLLHGFRRRLIEGRPEPCASRKPL
eukprot:354031-Chlamydomonas_euryale.AAC.4